MISRWSRSWRRSRRPSFAVAILAVLVAAVSLGGPAAGAQPSGPVSGKMFRAGALAIDVTPTRLPVIVNGGMLEGKASAVTDPLFARCLVLDDGTARVAIAVVDSCVLPRPLVEEAKALARQATGIPTGHMLISATHCHSAPSVCGALGTGVDEEYARFLPARIAEGIAGACRNLAPARIGWAVGKDPKNVFCRRFVMKPGTAATNPFSGTSHDQAQMNPGYQNPTALRRTGPVDTDVSVVSIQTRGGRPVAVLGNYSTHYAGAPPLSADYFGVFCRRIGELIGAQGGTPQFVGMMSNGTSGDANCCDFLNPPRKFDRFTVGEDVARAAFEAYRTIRYCDWVPLVVEEKLLTLAVRMPRAEEVAKARDFLAAVPGGKPRDVPEVYARETILLSQMPPTRELKLQAIRIGTLGIAAIPNEVFGSTGLAIKAACPLRPTINIELANGYFGYIPPPDQFPLGGYTTWRARSSCLEVQAEPKIRDAVLELLDKVARKRSGEAAVVAAAGGPRERPAEKAPVGVAKVDITPEDPVRMYGYGARTTESLGVAGRLKAAALALGTDAGDGPAVLLAVDCGAVPANICREVLRRVQAKAPLKAERFMLANSHNHSGADLKGMGSMSGNERRHLEQYAKELTGKLEDVVLKALAARRPGRLAWTQGSVGFAANRRVLKEGKWVAFGAVPDGAADHSLPLLRVTDADGKLLAVVVNYACHNTTLRGDFKQIHGDWAACAQESIEADHPGAVAMVTVGCGADADPRPHGTVELCRRHGRALADEVNRLLAGPFKPVSPKLSARSTMLEIPFDPPPPIDELRKTAKNSYPAERLLKRLERGEKPPATESYQIATWVFGNDLAMVFLADEVVVDYALRMKRELDGSRLWINAYSNDVSAYVVSNRLLGEGGYEVNNSLSAQVTYGRPERLRPTMEERIVQQVKALLPEGFRSPK